MRTTWIILALTVLIGAGLYFYFMRKEAPGNADRVSLVNTPDSIAAKTQIFFADDPLEVFYHDSTWQFEDSTKLRSINVSSSGDTLSKAYPERTLFISYDNKWFFDLELKKPDSSIAYDIQLQLKPQNDSLLIYGTIDQKGKGKLQFRNPMMRIFNSFVITYNEKIPDSLRNDSSSKEAGPAPSKTITVLQR